MGQMILSNFDGDPVMRWNRRRKISTRKLVLKPRGTVFAELPETVNIRRTPEDDDTEGGRAEIVDLILAKRKALKTMEKLNISPELRQRLLDAQSKIMSVEEMKEQIISFAYGNTHLSNPNVTKEMVREEFEKLEEENGRI